MFLTFHDRGNPDSKIIIRADEITSYSEYDDGIGGVIYLRDYSDAGSFFDVIEKGDEFKKIISSAFNVD